MTEQRELGLDPTDGVHQYVASGTDALHVLIEHAQWWTVGHEDINTIGDLGPLLSPSSPAVTEGHVEQVRLYGRPPYAKPHQLHPFVL